jgi:hypothetical protein
LTTCQYTNENPYPTGFACKEPTVEGSKFCLFHSKDYHIKDDPEAIKKLENRIEEKVKESIDNNKPLECFGYSLPDIDFAKLLGGKSFEQPVYFNDATFYGKADFL